MKHNDSNHFYAANSKGFSLVELMVVVAIIGVLSSFAIPQYQAFQSKSRQKEATSSLAAFYKCAQASFTELGQYPGNFVTMGYAPTGPVHYRITSADNAATLPAGAIEEAACIDTAQTCVATVSTFKKWSEDSTTPNFKVIAPTATATVANTTFLAVGSAVIKAGGTIDEWTINESKTFSNSISGL
jgi:prepilin-type N-terminal cleavage/methylation domain-containing protein